MDTEDWHRMARFYGVPVAALMMAPEEGGPIAMRMVRAAARIANMTEEDAEDWLRIGLKFEDKDKPKD